MKQKNRSPRDIGFYILVFIILASAVYLLVSNQGSNGTVIDYSDVRRLFMEDNVESFNIKDNTLTMKLRANYPDTNSDIVTHELYSINIFYEDIGPDLTEKLQTDDSFDYNYDVGWQAPWWFQLIPYVAIIIVFILLWNAMMNRSGVGGDKSVIKFGKARTRLATEEKKKVTFADVAGADEEKEELREIVDFLKGPQKYISLGARSPSAWRPRFPAS